MDAEVGVPNISVHGHLTWCVTNIWKKNYRKIENVRNDLCFVNMFKFSVHKTLRWKRFRFYNINKNKLSYKTTSSQKLIVGKIVVVPRKLMYKKIHLECFRSFYSHDQKKLHLKPLKPLDVHMGLGRPFWTCFAMLHNTTQASLQYLRSPVGSSFRQMKPTGARIRKTHTKIICKRVNVVGSTL